MATGVTAPAAPADLLGQRRKLSLPVVPTLMGAVVIGMLFTAVFADFLAPHSPTAASLIDSLTPPFFVEGGNTTYKLGTDIQGRDQLSRLIYGARISITVALWVLGLATAIGVTLGLLAGYLGGKWDIVIMRLVDITLSFPPLLIAIVMAVVFGPSFANVVLIIALFYWPLTARQVRAEVLALKVQDFVILAKCSGASTFRVLHKHILPGVIPTMLVITTLQVGTVIIFESSLSFLGVGIPPPNPSWGVMIADGRGQLATGWWLSLFPGLAIFVTVLAMNTLGDWLRDQLDPRLRTL